MIVLDTHVLVWWVNGGGKLTAKSKRIIEKHKSQERSILISSISAWELAMLVSKGRLALSMDVESWLDEVSKIPAIEFVPITNEIAVRSTILPGDFHKDPADRMIVSLARQLSIPLVTADAKLQGYKHVKTVW